MDGKTAGATVFRMDDESWRRHANPWSVWTRFLGLVPLAAAIWSRDWIGWWALAAAVPCLVWMWLNTRVFPPVEPRQWAAKGIYGEHLWTQKDQPVRHDHQVILRILIVAGLSGMGIMAAGLVMVEIWPTLYGFTLLVMAQLWRIDRMVWLYELVTGAAAGEPPRSGAA